MTNDTFEQHMAFTCDCISWQEHQDRALDASRPATDPAGLDVERLAEALYFTLGDPVTEPFHGEGEQRAWLRKAREVHARLAVADGPGPEERLRLIAALAAVRSRGEMSALSGEHVHWTDADVADLLLAEMRQRR